FPLLIIAVVAFVYWKLLDALINRVARTIGWIRLRRSLPIHMLTFALLVLVFRRFSSASAVFEPVAVVLIAILFLLNFPLVLPLFLFDYAEPIRSWQYMTIAAGAVWLLWRAIVWRLESLAVERNPISIATWD